MEESFLGEDLFGEKEVLGLFCWFGEETFGEKVFREEFSCGEGFLGERVLEDGNK